MGASIGIALAGERTAAELLREADIAMYRAKWDGKNRYAVFETGMQDTIEERAELEMDLRDALERNEFFLAYQPTLALSDMSRHGRRGADPLEPSRRGASSRPTTSFRSPRKRAHHGDRHDGSCSKPAHRARRGERPDIRSAWRSTSRHASSTATS